MRTCLAILLFAGSIALVAASLGGYLNPSQSSAPGTPTTQATTDATVLDV